MRALPFSVLDVSVPDVVPVDTGDEPGAADRFVRRTFAHALSSFSSRTPASPRGPPAAARFASEVRSAMAGHRTPPSGHATGDPTTTAARVA